MENLIFFGVKKNQIPYTLMIFFKFTREMCVSHLAFTANSVYTVFHGSSNFNYKVGLNKTFIAQLTPH